MSGKVNQNIKFIYLVPSVLIVIPQITKYPVQYEIRNRELSLGKRGKEKGLNRQ